MVLLVLLLLSQLRAIEATSYKWSALLAAVVIGIPWVIVLQLYMRVSNPEDNADTIGSEQKDAAAHEKTAAKTVDIRIVRQIFESAVEEYGLSGREEEVAWLLYRGYTNRQIGEELFIAETTVKKHVSHIYAKMQVMSRKEFRCKVGGLQE